MKLVKTKTIFLTGIGLVFSVIFSFSRPQLVYAQNSDYRALRVKQSYSGVFNIRSGKAFTFWVKFKNIGQKTWYNSGPHLVALDVSDPYGRQSPFQHQWWRTWYCPAKLLEKQVKPGEVGTFRFALLAPETPGLYSEKFQIAAKDIDWIPGGKVEVVIRVENPNYKGKPTSKKSSSKNSKNRASSEEKKIVFNPKRYKVKKLIEYPLIKTSLKIKDKDKGPEIRIGLYSTTEPIIIKANSSYQIRDKKDKLLVNLTKGEKVEAEFNFDKKRYYLKENGRRILMTDSYLKFIPKNEDNIFEIVSNKNKKGWESYSKFKGKLEIRFSDDGYLWLINELPLEDYLKGMAETGNNNPQDYLKAMAIAERTYALYHLLNPTKHAVRHFTLTASAGDQVYRGYSRQLQSPNVVKAVKETKGLVITYHHQIVVTPYFAQSDGWTKGWEEVWGGGPKPWLKPKYVPYDEGEKLFGHGVGMSAWGAWHMAKNNYNFVEILKYFYTNIELERVY